MLCLNNDDCYHVNGTCVKGCLPGYMGDKCKTRKLSIFSLHPTYFFRCRNITQRGFEITYLDFIFLRVRP